MTLSMLRLWDWLKSPGSKVLPLERLRIHDTSDEQRTRWDRLSLSESDSHNNMAGLPSAVYTRLFSGQVNSLLSVECM